MTTATAHPAAADGVLADFAVAGSKLIDALRRLPPSGTLDDASVETFYAIAYNALAARRYQDASTVFGMLVAVRPADPRFMGGLGRALRGLGDLQTAATMLALAGGLDTEGASHHLTLAEVLVAQGRRDLAALVLESVMVYASELANPGDIRERAEALLSLLHQHDE